MSTPKIIAVIGATGAQGGSLAQAILSDTSNEFACRAITRKPDSDAARLLLTKGSEVIAADLDDVDSLIAAFTGAHGAFCVTNFWEHFSAEKEKQQAKNMADAARAAGVKHVIWSTLEDTRDYMEPDDTRMPRLQGDYAVPHFDAKSEADAYFEGLPTTFLRVAFYWDNLYAFGLGPKKDDDGTYSWTFPMDDKKLGGIAAEDIGKIAYGIFKAGDRFFGQTIGVASEFLTIVEMGEQLSEVLNIGPITYNNPTTDMYRAFGFPGAEEMGNMFQIYRDFHVEFAANRSTELARELNPEMLTYREFLGRYRGKFAV